VEVAEARFGCGEPGGMSRPHELALGLVGAATRATAAIRPSSQASGERRDERLRWHDADDCRRRRHHIVSFAGTDLFDAFDAS
jgi:hypothetical protein